MEVFRQLHSKKVSKPSCHITIAGQCIIKSKSRGNNQKPDGKNRFFSRSNLLNCSLYLNISSCQNHKLCKPRNRQLHPGIDSFQAEIPIFPLLAKLGILYNRTCIQLCKKTGKQQVIHDLSVKTFVPVIDIDNISHGSNGINQ